MVDAAWDGRIRVALIDGFDVHGVQPGRLTTPAKRVLAFLAVCERPRPREYVAFSLWPGATEDRAAASFRNAICKIRDHTPRLLTCDTKVIGLAPDVAVDYHELRASAYALGELPADSTVHRLVDAYSKDLLPEWYDGWIAIARARWLELRLHALDALTDRLIVEGRYMAAMDAAVAAVAIEPIRETSRRTLIRAYIAEGNMARAICEFERFRMLLRRDLDVEPSPELRHLVRPEPPG